MACRFALNKTYTMKKISFLLISTLLISTFSSCNAIDKLTQFEVSYDTKFTIPSTIGIDLPFNIPTPDITTNISEKLANEQTNKELIEQLFLRKLILTTQNPKGKSFSFLKNVDLYLKTNSLPKVKVAYKHNITNSIGSELKLDIVKDVDLQEYVKDDHFTVEAEVTIDEITLEKIEIKADLTFWVDAKILGI